MNIFKIVPAIKTLCQLTSSIIGMNRQQDIAVFERLNTVLDEGRLAKMLNYSFFTESLHSRERELLYKFANALQSAENQYLHPIIKLRARQLASEMSELLQTVDATFSSDDGEIFRFRHDQKDSTAYNREWDVLHDRIDKTWKAYKAYSQGVKDRLKL